MMATADKSLELKDFAGETKTLDRPVRLTYSYCLFVG
jgi:hypothetical protein